MEKLYKCDPQKNTGCLKTNCYLNGGECTSTTNKKYEYKGITFTIPLQPITKKNSQQILVNRKTGRPFIMPSKKYREYEKQARQFIPKVETIDYPINVKCLFYMQTHRKCDLTNLLEAIDDVLVKCGLLEDDNFTIIESHDGSRVLYDKEQPRTEVYINKIS